MKRLIMIFLALLLLGGCAETPDSIVDEKSGDTELHVSRQDNDRELAASVGDGVFSLRYIAEDTLNPFTCETETNRQLTSLLYENLLSVSEAFTLEPGLCSSWEADESGNRFTLHLRNDAYFSDGSSVTAEDVVYSLNRAKESSSLFANRLRGLASVSAQDDYTVELHLRAANHSFLLRLDIPIVKTDTGYDDIPLGSGPYVKSVQNGKVLLKQNTRYSEKNSLPFRQIYLSACQEEELTDALNTGALDLILADPATLSNMGSLNGISRHAVSTSILSCLLVNTASEPLADAGRRRLVNSMLDREGIGVILNGETTLLPIHPSLPEYDKSTAEAWIYTDIPNACIQVLTEDYDGDGMLEYFSKGLPVDFSLTLLACSDNPFSAAAAHSIVNGLKKHGVTMTLQLLNEKDYLSAVERGAYDLCLLSMRLTADFDLESLANKTADMQFIQLSEAFRITQGEERQHTASELAAYLCENCLIMPLTFQYRIVLTSDEMQYTMEPTWTDPFYRMTSWNIP